MNPTQRLRDEIKTIQGAYANLSHEHGKVVGEKFDLEVKHGKLKARHSELIEASVKIENDLDFLGKEVEKFCGECVARGQDLCKGCCLNKFLV